MELLSFFTWSLFFEPPLLLFAGETEKILFSPTEWEPGVFVFYENPYGAENYKKISAGLVPFSWGGVGVKGYLVDPDYRLFILNLGLKKEIKILSFGILYSLEIEKIPEDVRVYHHFSPGISLSYKNLSLFAFPHGAGGDFVFYPLVFSAGYLNGMPYLALKVKGGKYLEGYAWIAGSLKGGGIRIGGEKDGFFFLFNLAPGLGITKMAGWERRW